MKITVWCDNGANIHSKRRATIDLERDWGISDDEWNEMPEEEKDSIVREWALERLDYGWSDE